MKVSTIIKIVSTSLAVILITFILLCVSNANERAAIATKASFRQLGLDLSGASDLLTNQARAYVQYGEKKYYDAYMEEINVTQTRDRVVAELERLGAPQNELALVEKAFGLSQTLAELETKAFEAVDRGDLDAARRLMFGSEYEEGKEPIVSTMKEFQETMEQRTDQAAESAQALAQMMLIIFAILFGGTTVVVVVSLMSIQKKMRLVAALGDCASKMASGSTDIAVEAASNDEIGVLAESFKEMADAIKTQAQIAEHLATGDLTVEVCPRSGEDTMGIALEKTVNSLNNLFGQIGVSTTQVSIGSKQIADNANELAQRSVQQSSAVEQLSSSIAEVAAKTNENAEMAERAASLSGTIRSIAEKGSRQMDQMMDAVREINEAGASINKVIKVIDDIAFQTNILALNAAVEAARAGQHGKGFSVVAEEVRSLAAKSAEAAKDTGDLIENSVAKSNLGLAIATDTAASLQEIVDGINQSAEIVSNIAQSSDEQAKAITTINTGIERVAGVIQQNSATAEENASASEEMSRQSHTLEELIATFKIKKTGGRPLFAPADGLLHKTTAAPADEIEAVDYFTA